MKRFAALVAALLLVVALSVTVWAYSLPSYRLVDGNTVVGTFILEGIPADSYSLWQEIWSSSKGHIFLRDDGEIKYYFCYLGDHQLTFGTSNGRPYFVPDMSFDYLEFTYQSSSASYVLTDTVWNYPPQQFVFDCAVGSVGSSPVSLPNLGIDYIASYTGELIIQTDEGEPAEEEPGNDGLLGWLSAFWDKLKNLFVSIFVPPDGYFTDWFNEIRSAFDSKFGNLGTLWDSLTASFAALKTSDANMTGLYLTIPNNHWFPGSKGISVNLIGALLPYVGTVRGWFNAILIVFTALTVYRNITAMLKK